ncbi:hypothetical protein EVAR_79091_1 [Eumeta japonica]|uniref:Uncharacterized protein n=1 Tax=Eumeta variegata TaxID=151549 RepID=A0A4C1X3X7_EUMVA|nr:hypothetical protein EVAR_79091_1 [Eumeta japonica]
MLTEPLTNMPTWTVTTAICKFGDTSPLARVYVIGGGDYITPLRETCSFFFRPPHAIGSCGSSFFMVAVTIQKRSRPSALINHRNSRRVESRNPCRALRNFPSYGEPKPPEERRPPPGGARPRPSINLDAQIPPPPPLYRDRGIFLSRTIPLRNCHR